MISALNQGGKKNQIKKNMDLYLEQLMRAMKKQNF